MKSSLLALALVFGLASASANAQSMFIDEGGVLVVNGSSRHETITVWQQSHWMRGGGRATFVYASIQAFGFSMQERFNADEVDEIEINAAAGNDKVENKTNINSEIQGGRGNDILKGGSGHDIIYGGMGSNELYGREGLDWLVSDGDAYNYLVGGMGEDVILAHPYDQIYDPKYSDDGTELIGYSFLLWPTFTQSNGLAWFYE